MKIRQVLAFAALVIGLGTASVAKADPMCVNQAVTAGLACSLGDLTFTFEAVTGVPSGNLSSISLITPSTGISGGVATLEFGLLATYPLDINLVYEVSSTSADITQLDSAFTNGDLTPPGSIIETACSVDPELHGGICPAADVITSFTNPPNTLSATFGPESNIWIDKDITDNGFSEFEDTVHETTTPAIPEPSSFALFGTGLLAAAGALRRRLKA